jgi:hypothetical protein
MNMFNVQVNVMWEELKLYHMCSSLGRKCARLFYVHENNENYAKPRIHYLTLDTSFSHL